MPVLPALVAVLAGLWRLGTPSLWRDEAATLSAADRPVGDLLAMLGDVDAVHGAYYLFMHGWIGVFGSGATAVRMPGVLAMGVAAGGTALIGRRLADAGTGLLAGLLVALSPLMARYGQEARQYTVITAVAVVSTYLLARAVHSRTSSPLWIGYAFSVTLLGWLHLFALLLLPVHALVLLPVGRRRRPDRTVLVRWAIAMGQGLCAVVPVALIALPQSSQVSWITEPDGDAVGALLRTVAGSGGLVVPMVLLALLGLWARPGGPDGPDGVDLRLLGLVWAVVPPAVLLGVSLIQPYYVLRYVIFCAPGLALLVALGLRRLTVWGAVPGLVVILLLTIPTQLEVREPDSRADDLHTLASTVQGYRWPGDAIVFHHAYYRRVMAAYPAAFEGLRDVALDRTAVQVRQLQGTDVADPAVLAARLRQVRRLWYVDNYLVSPAGALPQDEVKDRLVRESRLFRRVARWRFTGVAVSLYVRR